MAKLVLVGSTAREVHKFTTNTDRKERRWQGWLLTQIRLSLVPCVGDSELVFVSPFTILG